MAPEPTSRIQGQAATCYFAQMCASMRLYHATEPVMVALAALVFGLLFSYPLLNHLTVAGAFWDWDYAMQLAYAARESIWRYHQLPLWNPWKCAACHFSPIRKPAS
jgi:hypothetical protein